MNEAIYVDEIDKIAKKRVKMSLSHVTFLVKGTTSPLEDLEGTVASVPPQRGHKAPSTKR